MTTASVISAIILALIALALINGIGQVRQSSEWTSGKAIFGIMFFTTVWLLGVWHGISVA